ncbi:MAG: class I SAM-dependent methyltransferase [Candidatus Magasanikbacteria bacterium]|nr:class I SAM-dependent methyltransferase [Candidatus Magasanikbacteria bacterium]
MSQIVHKSKTCLVCGGTKLSLYLDLGKSALANSYISPKDKSKKEFKARLAVYYCHTCHLAQLLDIVDRNVLFKKYAYFSSTSPQLLNHFDEFAQDVMDRFEKQSKHLVVEIASNDGILLKPLKERGAKVLGIDPAKNIAAQANKIGIPTVADFFNRKTAKKIKETHGSAGVVIANNVLAHTDILHEIIQGAADLLADDGVFVFEAQYLKDLIAHNEFDNTYHEHICYFSLHPLVELLKRHDMKVFDVKHVDTQGGSLRVYAAKNSSSIHAAPRVAEMLKDEVKFGLTKFATFKKFAARPPRVARELKKILTKLHEQGKTVVGYGAPAKGNTMLQYAKIDRKLVTYIVDNAPSKQGLLAPGSRIPIFAPTKLHEDTPDYILILAWNYADSIMNRESWFKKRGGKFIIPVPMPVIK